MIFFGKVRPAVAPFLSYFVVVGRSTLTGKYEFAEFLKWLILPMRASAIVTKCAPATDHGQGQIAHSLFVISVPFFRG